MTDRVVFYQLSARFLHKGQTVPPDAEQVLYYSLGIGHHVGVIDTFKPILNCSYVSYTAAVAALPEGEARRKLDGLRRFGEIIIDSTHTRLLRGALSVARPSFDAEAEDWCSRFDQALQTIDQEPVITLMIRRQP
jgi:Formate hydrogenlyase maturation protein HycH